MDMPRRLSGRSILRNRRYGPCIDLFANQEPEAPELSA